ncbi:MAG: PspC domain-containing protein, partial [Eudoraea sp.]
MTENQDNLNNLSKKLETLLKRQDIFLAEVNALKAEINQLKQAEIKQPSEKKETIEDKPSYQSGNASQPVTASEPVTASQPGTASKKLYRDVNHRILGGVCSGIAEYLGLNRILIRFLWLLFSFFFGIGFLAYIILWIAIPKIKKTSTVQKPSPISTEKPPVEKKQVLEEKAVIFNTPAKNQ